MSIYCLYIMQRYFKKTPLAKNGMFFMHNLAVFAS